MSTGQSKEKRVLLKGRFLAIFVSGFILSVIFLILFNLLTTDTSVLFDINADNSWWSALQGGQTDFWYQFIEEYSPFFDHLAQNSLVYMIVVFIILLVTIAFFMSYKKKKDLPNATQNKKK